MQQQSAKHTRGICRPSDEHTYQEVPVKAALREKEVRRESTPYYVTIASRSRESTCYDIPMAPHRDIAAKSPKANPSGPVYLNAPPPVPPRDLPKSETDGVVLSPNLVVQMYGGVLPLKFIVTTGVCGSNRATTFAEGDVITAHFSRQMSYALVREKSGLFFKIPMASLLRFGLLYCPCRNLDQALEGYTFMSVNDILNLKPMPKLVIAQRGWRGSNSPETIEFGELLWVKGEMYDPQTPQFRFLKVVHALNGQVTLLRSDASIPLSTKPSLLLLPLTEIVKHVQPPFDAVVESPKNTALRIPAGMKDSNTVTVQESIIDTSIIASRKGASTIFEIPALLDMGLHINNLSEKEMEHLRLQTLTIFNSFSPAQVSQHLTAEAIARKFKTSIDSQLLLLKLVDQDHFQKSQQLVLPPNIRRLDLKTPPKKTAISSPEGLRERLPPVEKTSQALLSDVKTLKEQFVSMKTAPLMNTSQEMQEVRRITDAALHQIAGIISENMSMPVQYHVTA